MYRKNIRTVTDTFYICEKKHGKICISAKCMKILSEEVFCVDHNASIQLKCAMNVRTITKTQTQ